MATSLWRKLKSFPHQDNLSCMVLSSDTVPLDFSEDEDDVPTFTGAGKLQVGTLDQTDEIAHVPTVICNGTVAASGDNVESCAELKALQEPGFKDELPGDGQCNEEECKHCVKNSELVRQRTVKRKLWIAVTLYSLFTIGELMGGWLSNSLAVMTDAVHMLADVLGIAASLVALYLSARPPSNRFTFGWHRFEALAAVLSVFLIYAVTVGLVYEAVQRTIHQDFEIHADVMIIIAAVGVAINLIMGFLLKQSTHPHSHCPSEKAARGASGNAPERADHSGNLAVRAAFIHALGDVVQSVGVLVAAYIIRFKPAYKIADPICTYIFSFLVLCTTFRIIRDTALIFLEGTPRHLDVHRIRDSLLKIEDVHSVQDLNVWSLTMGRTAAIVHLRLIPESTSRWEDVQCKARHILLRSYGVHRCTVQLQVYKESSSSVCTKCGSLDG
ncbi:zinc transporter 4 [Pristis pectinata]|uniref:zinc transporter 4 n=1 Tax=Pristis pectinata TaxID=685728 RepID=UPI00223CEBA3|nr:zinc transporter 4 [Pristis pectinata]XP_051896157.1 zinc transporter 4 [Pristis pectinata]